MQGVNAKFYAPAFCRKTPWPPLGGGSARRRWGRELHAGTKVSGKGEALSLRPFGPPLPLWRKRHLPRIGGVCLPEGGFLTRSAAQARKSLRGAVFMRYQERFFLWAARPSAAPLHRASANSSATFMPSPVWGMVMGGCGIIEDGELCWPPPGHTTICCNFGEPDGYGFRALL